MIETVFFMQVEFEDLGCVSIEKRTQLPFVWPIGVSFDGSGCAIKVTEVWFDPFRMKQTIILDEKDHCIETLVRDGWEFFEGEETLKQARANGIRTV